MKNFNYKIILSFLLVAVIGLQVNAQKDTTELEIGKKKMIIVDKKAQKEKAIENLEKGLEKFEIELQKVEEKTSHLQIKRSRYHSNRKTENHS